MRLDQFLVDNKHFTSRSKAKEYIISEGVEILNALTSETKIIKTPSYKITENLTVNISFKETPITKFVSRAGLKLEGAIEHLNLKVKDLSFLDVGISTGGFTDCLLQHGAESIVGIDVGHDQLSQSLRADSRVTSIEGLNIKDLNDDEEFNKISQGKFDACVVDVSFISLIHVIKSVVKYVRDDGFLLVLVKPQFEMGPSALNKKGVIKNESSYTLLEEKIRELFKNHDLKVLDYFSSSIKGKKGNKEFFIYAKK